MMPLAHAVASMLAAFLASLVEGVEALTVVLAVGTVRGWRSALTGTGMGIVSLLILIVVLGPALARVPLGDLQFVVGVMLILFGLRWLRKAILRASGVIALRDEAAAFASASETLRDSGARRTGLDLIAVATAYKTVTLEGLEVVFIVIAVGAAGGLLGPASFGAAMALAMVVALGLIIHRPLARLPENTLKFAVGILLSAFGTFWTGEGIGAAWPGGDWSILVLIAAFFAVASASVLWCRTRRAKHYSSNV